MATGISRLTSRVAQMFMDTPQSTVDTPSSLEASQSPPSVSSPDQYSVDVGEMRMLVDALDSTKSGTVDYTLLVAAVPPPDVYCEEHRSAEAFHSLDVKKQGAISPDCLKKIFPGRD